jgi:hypothetical protein
LLNPLFPFSSNQTFKKVVAFPQNMSQKKLHELQPFLKINNQDSLNKFILQNNSTIDQIFMEHILQKKPNSNLIFQILTQRIQNKQFNLQNKEEHYTRKLIQFMEKNFKEQPEVLKLFQLYFNLNPEKKKILIYLTNELSSFGSDLNFLGALVSGLKTGMGGNWLKFYQNFLPMWMGKFQNNWRDPLIFKILTKIVNDEELEKTEKFQIIYKEIEEFLDFSRENTMVFISNFSNELTKSQLIECLMMFQTHIPKENYFSKAFEIYVKFIKTVFVKYPNEFGAISQE